MKNWTYTLSLTLLAMALAACGQSTDDGSKKIAVDEDVAADVQASDATADTTADTQTGDTAQAGDSETADLVDATAKDTGVDAAVDTQTGDTTGDTTAVDAQPDAAPDCNGPKGCFACKPTQTVEFLNQCNGLTCEPFDNVKKLPLLKKDGSLPPLP